MPQRLRRMLRWWPVGVICLLVGASFLLRTRSKPVPIVPSPETTYVMGPLNSEGLIDYETALNEQLSKGITPDQNANVLIVKVLGPKPEGYKLPPAFYTWLGIDPLPEEGIYFQRWRPYADAHWTNPPPEQAFQFDTGDKWREVRDKRFEETSRRHWKAQDEPEVVRWLKKNEEPLARLKELSRRPQYYNPLVSYSVDPRPRLFQVLLPTVQATQALEEALICRTMLAMEENRYEEAWDDLMTCHHLGDRLVHGGTLIEGIAGRAILNRAMKAQIVLLSLSPVSSTLLKKQLSDLQQFPPLEPFGTKFCLSERYILLDLIQSMVNCSRSERREQAQKLKPFFGCGQIDLEPFFSRSIDYSPILRKVNQHYDHLTEIVTWDRHLLRNEVARLKESYRSDERSSFALWMMGDKEFTEEVGECLLSLFMPSIERHCDHFDRTRQAQQNLKIAFALAIYRAEKGRYPAKLTEMAPAYLPALPDDLFTGKPLIYRLSAEGYLLYSVGPNEEDNEGKGDDVAIQLPLPPLEEPQ